MKIEKSTVRAYRICVAPILTPSGFSLVHPTARDSAGSPVIVDDGDRHYLHGVRSNHAGLTRTERIAAGFGTAQDFAERDAERNANE